MNRIAVFLITSIASVFASVLSPLSAHAEEPSSLRLTPGWETDEGTHMIGAELRLAPGWKTYWRSPGAGGIPPHFDWSGSENVAKARILWPRPEVFESFGATSIGYQYGVLFPVEITPTRADAPVLVRLALSYGLCEDVCIPAYSTASLPANTAPSAAEEAALRAAILSLPTSAAEAGITEATCRLDGETVTAALRHEGTRLPEGPLVFETGSELTYLTTTAIRIAPGSTEIDAAISHYGESAPELAFETLRITLLGPASAVDITGC